MLAAQTNRSTGGLMTTLQLAVVVKAVPLVESVTCPVKLNVPGAVGVPVMAPVAGSSVRPGGSEPAVIAKV